MTGTSRRNGTAAGVLLLLVLAGCGGGGGDSRGVPAPATTSPDASTATDTGAPSEATSEPTPTPSVAPATGIELVEATSALNAPAGWTEADALLDYASAADGPGARDSLLLADHQSLAGPDATHDSLADSWFDVAPQGAKAERLPDVDLAGTPAYCIFYTVKGDPSLNYDIGTVRNGQSIDISFVLDKRTLEKDPELVESVLASFRWLD